MSTLGTEQRTCSPVAVFTKRKPPAVAFAVLDFATMGRLTRAILVAVLVITEPGDTPTIEMPAESQAGIMPGAVVQVKVPVAGSSPALAEGVTAMAVAASSAVEATAARIMRFVPQRVVRRRMATPAIGEGRVVLGVVGQDNRVSNVSEGFLEDLTGRLRAIVGETQVLDTPELVEPYCVDWTRRFGGPALAVVRPGSVDEVSAVMRVCAAAGVPVLPQGGNTGLVGGSVPAPGTADGAGGQIRGGGPPVIVSTRRLSWIDPIDGLSGQMSVGAGATLGDVQRAAHATGWEYGVDLAARDSATIGGTVATNAGGIRVLAYGMTRAQVCGIEAVLPDGSVISHMSGLAKDNTGFDLAGLLCGSEGTLAIITAVRLRLHRPHGRTSVALIGCADYRDALEVTRSAASAPLIAAEVIDATGMELVRAVAGLPYPLATEWPLVVLLEVADGGGGGGFVVDVLADRDVVVGVDSREIERLWEYRERQAEAFGTLGVIHKLDVSVPLPALPACADELHALLSGAASVSAFGMFGHVADGNLHVEFVGPGEDDDAVDTSVLESVARYGGSISAEHGIGRLKAGHLELSRSQAEIAAMKAIKNAWDPQGLMNPGVLFG